MGDAREEQVILDTYHKYEKQLKSPLKLADILDQALSAESSYAGIFIPGGHGVKDVAIYTSFFQIS